MSLQARIAKLEGTCRHSWAPIIAIAATAAEALMVVGEERKRRGLTSGQLVPTICVTGSASR